MTATATALLIEVLKPDEEDTAMADDLRMTLLETLRKAGLDQDVAFLREGVCGG